ncbi:hypothetical protein QVG61_02625 [Thiohalobacter sp. IOR34]|uniref:hypothetical protein n=1 Tax=Thiohalobacter sp. IOR34 TaxID=3057176 RepID=UPI0025B06E19|nr:hypothetical protein [Thiohalobacter sp. IOR34]WJW76004.1 hypothetical protein QVG61_02625 [Thiohalobacter sp. IOR34]
MSGNARVDSAVERLCADGCQAVREYILALQERRSLAVFEGLDGAERELLLRELQAIMAVYGDCCRL